jgi:hypothetical protein
MCSSEISVDFQRTTRRYIPEDSLPYRDLNFDPSVDQTVASRYTDYAILVPLSLKANIYFSLHISQFLHAACEAWSHHVITDLFFFYYIQLESRNFIVFKTH